jgi:hypothetical protein
VSQLLGIKKIPAKPQSSVFSELAALTRKTIGVVPVLRETLKTLHSGCLSVWVNGSVAKQTDIVQVILMSSLIEAAYESVLVRYWFAVPCLEPTEVQLSRKIIKKHCGCLSCGGDQKIKKCNRIVLIGFIANRRFNVI